MSENDAHAQLLHWMMPILPFFPKVKAMFEDKVIQVQEIRQSTLDWIIVRPITLTDGPRTGEEKVTDHCQWVQKR